ncbi:MAG: precorrin-6y C5,15-methyltransferase (decarboxylating) subunit CbiE [Carbonactinosporaceae bacterium]
MITILGFDGSPPPEEATEALGDATLVVGDPRHLKALPVPDGTATVALDDLQGAFAALERHDGRAVVVAGGDPGFFGLARAVRRHGLPVDAVLPARSSVAVAFGRLALSWEDAVVIHAGPRDLRRTANVCRAHHKVAVITGPGAGPRELAGELRGVDRTFVVAERLGEPWERIHRTTPAEAAQQDDWEEPNVVLVIDGTRTSVGSGWIAGATPRPKSWALHEEGFLHQDATTFEVRALALARLGPRLGDLVWDVGAGSGSVAIECARMGAAVVAVERDGDACDRMATNAVGHGASVQVVQGAAPAVLYDLPRPDAVFVGGGGPDSVEVCAQRRPRVVVVSLEAIDPMAEVRGVLRSAGYHVDGLLLQSSRLSPLPGGTHRLAAARPAFLMWGERR